MFFQSLFREINSKLLHSLENTRENCSKLVFLWKINSKFACWAGPDPCNISWSAFFKKSCSFLCSFLHFLSKGGFEGREGGLEKVGFEGVSKGGFEGASKVFRREDSRGIRGGFERGLRREGGFEGGASKGSNAASVLAGGFEGGCLTME